MFINCQHMYCRLDKRAKDCYGEYSKSKTCSGYFLCTMTTPIRTKKWKPLCISPVLPCLWAAWHHQMPLSPWWRALGPDSPDPSRGAFLWRRRVSLLTSPPFLDEGGGVGGLMMCLRGTNTEEEGNTHRGERCQVAEQRVPLSCLVSVHRWAVMLPAPAPLTPEHKETREGFIFK